MSDKQNAVLTNSMNILNSLSFYSPLIICISVILFSMLTVTLEKAFVFFIWVFLITFLRICIISVKNMYSSSLHVQEIPEICLTGLTQMFIPRDVTYSTYILCFTLMYFLMPMIMVSIDSKMNTINYGVLAFFISYIVLDLFIKKNLSCIPSLFSSTVIMDIIGGLGLGALIAGVIMYGTTLKSYLYINEINPNKEVCSMPSKQQFRCSVYKNGELVGSSIN